jgi:hypothetical protein
MKGVKYTRVIAHTITGPPTIGRFLGAIINSTRAGTASTEVS